MKVCPKCHSRDIVYVESGTEDYASGHHQCNTCKHCFLLLRITKEMLEDSQFELYAYKATKT